MNIRDELERLNQLHKDGTLSDDEFMRAKSRLINPPDEIEPTQPTGHRRADAANWDIAIQMVMIAVVVLFLAIFLLAIAPHWHHSHWFYR